MKTVSKAIARRSGVFWTVSSLSIHNVNVPFTLAHASAALPFRPLHLVTSALVVGTFAPDFEYFLRLAPGYGFGHTMVGAFVLTLPLALLVLWAFHRFVKAPVTMLLPDTVRWRLATYLVGFRFGGIERFLLIVGSALLGIATHLLWDSFTHPNRWPYRHWSVLRQAVRLPIVGLVPCHEVLQLGSTVLGLGVLFLWLVRWYQTTPVSLAVPDGLLSYSRKMAIISGITAVAILGAVLRALLGVGVPVHHLGKFVGQAVVTGIALAWWEFLVYGVILSTRVSQSS